MSAKFATFVHSHFLSIYFRDQIDPQFITNDIPNMETLSAFVESIVTRPEFIKGYPYNFIEGIIKNPFTLFQAFTKILAQRKVLVVSPFSESISVNFVNRRSFFKNGYMYPDFELCVVDTPITYGGMSQAMYPHRDWFETVDALKSKIRMQEFDIALLSCGSYAMMLGEFIQNELNKSAIYVGGVLQLFFGIMGRRYVNSYFLSQINSQEFIAPIERQRYLDMIPTSDTTAREAFGAYF